MQKKLLDMHAHLAALDEEYAKNHTHQEQLEYAFSELNLRRSQSTAAFFSCGNLREWEFAQEVLREFCEEDYCGKSADSLNEMEKRGENEEIPFWLSFGIHPWYSDRFWEHGASGEWKLVRLTEGGEQKLCEVRKCDMRNSVQVSIYQEIYERCSVIGEIGMDSVWCDIPLDIQRAVFVQQLKIAGKLNKPVILHTKGQEREIAELIQDFPGKVCVHWYSGDIETLEKFIQKDCYFTLGPDVGKAFAQKTESGRADGAGLESGFTEKSADAEQEDKASAELYRYMIEHIPAERLFLETDGISAVAWARGVSELPMEEIPAVLQENLKHLAECKGMTQEQMRARMWENLGEFIKK